MTYPSRHWGGTVAKQRNSRQDAIREIVRGKSIRTQRALVNELQGIGYNCTQATVSRDIADMGLRKLPEGIYVLSEDLHLQRMMSEFVTDVDSAANLVVVKAQPGTAPGVAAAIDAANLVEVKGSVAGNDTVLVVCGTESGADELVKLVNKLSSPNR
jgi:transcriptional regulator of arginine metabolism